MFGLPEYLLGKRKHSGPKVAETPVQSCGPAKLSEPNHNFTSFGSFCYRSTSLPPRAIAEYRLPWPCIFMPLNSTPAYRIRNPPTQYSVARLIKHTSAALCQEAGQSAGWIGHQCQASPIITSLCTANQRTGTRQN